MQFAEYIRNDLTIPTNLAWGGVQIHWHSLSHLLNGSCDLEQNDTHEKKLSFSLIFHAFSRGELFGCEC